MSAEDAILALARAKGATSSISPEDAARALDAEKWHARLHDVRVAAVKLAKEGRIQILRKGKPVDPAAFKGVIRYRIVDADGA